MELFFDVYISVVYGQEIEANKADKRVKVKTDFLCAPRAKLNLSWMEVICHSGCRLVCCFPVHFELTVLGTAGTHQVWRWLHGSVGK